MDLGRALSDLRLPILQAPMFLVSSQELAAACSRAGIVGAFQLGNPRTLEELSQWLGQMGEFEEEARAENRPFAPYCVNVNANAIEADGYRERFDLCEKARVPLVLSSIGNPADVVRRVHQWGGRVIHDVVTLAHAEKAMAAGVDGLMLTCAGAGGHNGSLSPFAFLPQVRERFDGLIVLAGGIASPEGIAAALTLGADMVCMGTRFVATRESAAPEAYKEMVVVAGTGDILETDAIAGLTANWLKPSLVANGLDPRNLPKPKGMHRPDLPEGVRAWKTVWSAGHSAGLIHEIPAVAELVNDWEQRLHSALPVDWRESLAARLNLRMISAFSVG